MLRNSLTDTGAYWDWWSHLESINYVLEKLLDQESHKPLNELDRERLEALAKILMDLSQLPDSKNSKSDEFLSKLNEPELSFVPDIDVSQCLRDLKEFREWHMRSKIGFDKKILRLTESIREYLTSRNGMLFDTNIPKEEFQILKKLIENLLVQCQPFLY